MSEIKYSDHLPIPFEPRDLFVAIVYNIKHGIEIYIKTIHVILKKEYNDHSHNIEQLFEDLRKIIPKIKAKKHLDGNKITKEDVDKIPQKLDALKNLIQKYYHIKLDIPLNVDFMDVKNDAFRYPDNNAVVSIDFEKIFESVNNKNIEELLKDIDQLITFGSVALICDIYTYGK